MNYFLTLIVLLVCGGAFYEHTISQEEARSDQEQIDDSKKKLDDLTAQNKQLDEDKAQLVKKLDEAQQQIAAANQKLVSLQEAIQTDHAAPVSAPAPPSPAAAPDPNDLGTVTTLDGQTFTHCQLLRVESDGITFSHTEGITKVLFGLLTPAMQKRFGYDPQAAEEKLRHNATNPAP